MNKVVLCRTVNVLTEVYNFVQEPNLNLFQTTSSHRITSILMADQNITLEESLANQMSSTETVSLQSLPIKDKDITLEEEESLADQMSKVSSLATTSLQSLTLPLLPPCFNYPELLFLIRRQRKVLDIFANKLVI